MGQLFFFIIPGERNERDGRKSKKRRKSEKAQETKNAGKNVEGGYIAAFIRIPAVSGWTIGGLPMPNDADWSPGP